MYVPVALPRRLIRWTALLLATACATPSTSPSIPSTEGNTPTAHTGQASSDTADSGPTDADSDGYETPLDCDDNDPLVNPGSPFTCVYAGLPTCASPLLDAFTEGAMDPPGWASNDYVIPDLTPRASLAQSVEAALIGDAETALQAALDAGYGLCAEGSMLLWSAPSASGHAALALRTHPEAIDLIVETPHSFFDANTLGEGVVVFERSGARALLSSGTHRCASDSFSGCAGSTPVCALTSTEDFRISDMAHTETSFFHAAHVALSEGLPETTVVQLHMFLEPGASVSNGTSDPTTPDTPSARLVEALAEALPTQLVTSCNDYGAGNDIPRVCGTSNTQGRHLNGSSDACQESGPAASGRFIHLEQNLSVIDRARAVADALATVF
jgi:hypothetical protein